MKDEISGNWKYKCNGQSCTMKLSFTFTVYSRMQTRCKSD